jgi:hypothetical protein
MRVTGVSYSSDKKLSRCEQQYSYRYDEKLKRKIKKIGLWRGEWMHTLLETYRRKQDWEKKWRELKKNVWDKLFDEEKENYGETFPQDIKELMEHYIEHWEPQDKNWKVIEIEKSYEQMTKFGWPIRWKADYLVRDGRRILLVENKNKKEIPDSSERILAPQVHAYCWLLLKVARIKVDAIIWDYVRTEPVPMPKINKDGSLSKRKINTDQRTYLKALKLAGIHPDNSEEWLDINEYIKTLPETLSLERVTNTPNFKIGELFVREWVERARRAESIKKPLRTWTRSCSWECDYKDLCMIDMLGKDRDLELKKNFIQITPSMQEEIGR